MMGKTEKGKYGAPSLLCEDLKVNGRLEAKGDMQIEGLVEGDIFADSVTIGEQAKITGQICASLITVHGQIEGSLRAQSVHLCATCRVEGDIYHESIAVESGAYLNGKVMREQDPLAKIEEMSSKDATSNANVTPLNKALDDEDEAEVAARK